MAGGSPALRSVVVAIAIPVLTMAGSVAVDFATSVPNSVTWWLVVGLVTVALGVLAAMSATGPEPRPPRPGQPPARSRGPSKGRAAITGLLVCAAVVGALIPGARYAYGWISGDEDGVDRLAEPVSASAGLLAVTVGKVEVTAHFTKVTMTVANDYPDTITLPLYRNAQLTAGTTTIEGDPFRSNRWTDSVPPKQSRTGTVVFGEPLDPAASTATVTFTTIFGNTGLRGPRSLAVEDVPLTPVR